MRIVEQIVPIPSLCYKGGKRKLPNYKKCYAYLERDALKIDYGYIGGVVREGYDLSDTKEAVT